jgi:filamentous hemagglutinin
MGTGVVETSAGDQVKLISTRKPNGYLRPGVTVKSDEVVVSGSGHVGM